MAQKPKTKSKKVAAKATKADFGKGKRALRAIPGLTTDGDKLTVEITHEGAIRDLLGVRTIQAANQLFDAALVALGQGGKHNREMAAAMFAEIEPTDAIEAMLVSQMTSTHAALSLFSSRMVDGNSYQIRESAERSATRLSRTYLAQMDALKKYRAKATAHIRVGKVEVSDSGQAIVGNVERSGD